MLNDVKNLKDNGSASIAELRAFLKTLKARNPQEVIGIVSTSLLVQSLLLSCFATAVLMVVFTAGPYFLYGPNKPATSSGRPPVAAAATADSKQPAESAATVETKPATSTGTPDMTKAAKAMGLDEAKGADPKKNPRDNPDLDKLLDGTP